MEKIKKLIKKVLTKEVILYLFFGVLTTIVNWASFYLLTHFLHMNESEVLKNIANFIAIFISVLVAYFSNRNLVFHSSAQNFKERVIEFGKFMLGRAFTFVLELLLGFIGFKIFTNINETIIKMPITVVVVILNFFISKFFAFKKKSDKESNDEKKKEKDKNKDKDKDKDKKEELDDE